MDLKNCRKKTLWGVHVSVCVCVIVVVGDAILVGFLNHTRHIGNHNIFIVWANKWECQYGAKCLASFETVMGSKIGNYIKSRQTNNNKNHNHGHGHTRIWTECCCCCCCCCRFSFSSFFSTYAMLVPVATHICSLISACLHSLRATATNAVVVTFCQ